MQRGGRGGAEGVQRECRGSAEGGQRGGRGRASLPHLRLHRQVEDPRHMVDCTIQSAADTAGHMYTQSVQRVARMRQRAHCMVSCTVHGLPLAKAIKGPVALDNPSPSFTCNAMHLSPSAPPPCEPTRSRPAVPCAHAVRTVQAARMEGRGGDCVTHLGLVDLEVVAPVYLR